MTTAKEWLGIMQQASNYNHAMTPLIIKYGEMLVEKRDAIIEALEELVKLQASYGKIGDIMELRQKIETLKKEIQ